MQLSTEPTEQSVDQLNNPSRRLVTTLHCLLLLLLLFFLFSKFADAYCCVYVTLDIEFERRLSWFLADSLTEADDQ